jgi:hypothetical protein
MKFTLTQKQVDTIMRVFDTPNLDLICKVTTQEMVEIEATFIEQLATQQLPKQIREHKDPSTCAYCGSALFNEKGECQKCGL